MVLDTQPYQSVCLAFIALLLAWMLVSLLARAGRWSLLGIGACVAGALATGAIWQAERLGALVLMLRVMLLIWLASPGLFVAAMCTGDHLARWARIATLVLGVLGLLINVLTMLFFLARATMLV